MYKMEVCRDIGQCTQERGKMNGTFNNYNYYLNTGCHFVSDGKNPGKYDSNADHVRSGSYRLVTPEEAVKGFASTTILMLIGVVIVGSALFETGVCDRVASVVTRYAKTERQMIMAILILSSIMSAGLSNSGTVAVFIPIILGITATTNFSRSKLMMSAFLGAMAGGRLTLVGDAADNVLIGNQIKELGQPFGFFEISKIGVPLTLIMLVYIYFTGYKFLPDIKDYHDEDQIFSQGAGKDVPKWKQIASVQCFSAYLWV